MHKTICLLALCLIGRVSTAQGDVAISHLFGDHMVLQRGIKVPVWGTAGPGEQVTRMCPLG